MKNLKVKFPLEIVESVENQVRITESVESAMWIIYSIKVKRLTKFLMVKVFW